MEKVTRLKTDAAQTKTSDALTDTAENPVLKWEVFVTPGIPVVTPDRPAGVRETYFQAMASTLI
jgi:hypothetical protein